MTSSSRTHFSRCVLILTGCASAVRSEPNAIRVIDESDSSVMAGFSSCYPSECSSLTELSVVEQFRDFQACLRGPAIYRGQGCGCPDFIEDGYVTLRDFAEFQNFPMQICQRYFSMEQQSGLGYCPITGAIHKATIIPSLDGSLILVGNLVFEVDPEIDQCIPESDYGCYTYAPFRARAMNEDEENNLAALLEGIPLQCDTGCSPNSHWYCCAIFDPCRILYLVYDSRRVDDYCFGCGNSEEYRAAIRNVLDYLTVLATED